MLTVSEAVDPATVALQCWALVPCAGSGSRAGAGLPKQYRVLAGQTLLQHTVAALLTASCVRKVVVVTAPGDGYAATLGLKGAKCDLLAVGGHSRAATVLNGLKALLEEGAGLSDWVLVHDAARCLIQPEQIEALVAVCRDDEVGGLLAVPLADTLKSAVGDRVHETLDRSEKWLAQTPQMFRLGQLIVALELAGDRATDEASAIEMLGLHPRLVVGDPLNLKVTYAQDFVTAELVLRERQRFKPFRGVKSSC